MSDKLRQYSNEVWDRFFDFISPCDDHQTRQEVQADLQQQGIDVRPAVARVKQALEARRARERLAAARTKRVGLIGSIKGMAIPIGQSLRGSLEEAIARMSGNQQAAYYHKLNKAQSEQDLQSLFEDLCRLEALEEDDDGGPDGK